MIRTKSALYIVAIAITVVMTGTVQSDAAVKHAARRVTKHASSTQRHFLRHAGLSQSVSYGTTSHRRTGPGSFIPYKADSIQEIVDQLKNNPNVAQRYAQHFGVTPDALNKYFLENLKLVVLDKPQKTTTYFVSRGGKILSRTCIIPKGTRVFADASGQAILEWRCGNPLTRKLPSHGTPPLKAAEKLPEIKVAPFEQEIGIFPPILTPQVMVLATTPVTMTPTLEPMIESTASFPMAFPPLLTAMVPLLFGAVSVQHSESGPPPVPEPSALMLALGVGLPSALVMRRMKKKPTKLQAHIE